MPHPYPSEVPDDGTVKKHENIYKYITNRRLVEIFAETKEDADQEFQERFGYAPTKENNA